MTTYRVYAEDLDGHRRYLDTVKSDNMGTGIFSLYADECGDEEEIVIYAIQIVQLLAPRRGGKKKN
jgi:hypothetical protein